MKHEPRSLTDVALGLFDRARQLGLAAALRCSRVKHSKSRYVYLNNQASDVIRISDHVTPHLNPSLNIIIRSPDQLKAGLQCGLEWLEGSYGTEIEASAAR